MPTTWPEASPASAEAAAAPEVGVTRALDADPPLPGEATSGWVGLAAAPAGASQHEHAGHTEAAVTYSCPMHPDVVSAQPGQCPRCGMTLVKRDAQK